MVIFIFIGLLVGIALALTGGGGALLAIPLLMNLLEFPLRVSTFISLIVVIIASLIGVIFSYKKVMLRESFFISIGSLLGSYVGTILKQSVAGAFITLLLVLISFIGAYFVWKPITSSATDVSQNKNVLVIFSIGILLGVLTGMTGLGGGVVLLPIFISYFHFDSDKAVATSLFAVLFSSLFAFSFQVSQFYQLINLKMILSLILGVFAANLSLKYLMIKLSDVIVVSTRKIFYSLIVLYTVSSLLIREFL